MTADQFLRQVEREGPQPVYLFQGPEQFRRRACRAALLRRALPSGDTGEGFTRHDLEGVTLAEVVDDARGMSLFVQERVIWVFSAEAALPRGRAAAADDEDGEGKKSDGSAELAAYIRDPSPGVVIVFDAARFDFEGEDKVKAERVRKFFGAVPAVVEFPWPDPQEARHLALEMAGNAGLKIGREPLDQLVEATGGDPTRIATEIEKLSLYRPGGSVEAEDIAALVPNAQETTIFALVNALARGDRRQALDLLDTLVREGEYLPLALTFLGGVFRLALAARESGLRSAQEVQTRFQQMGMPMWRSRAEQVWQTASRFPADRLVRAMELTFEADRALKSSRPDDKTILEDFVFRLTSEQQTQK